MKLIVYMKSGNKIVLRGVKKYTIRNQGDEIIEFAIEWRKLPFCQRMLVKTLALSQIEAVTRT